MPNVTISLDEELIKKSRSYAAKNNTSLNAMIRNLLKKNVTNSSESWLDNCFKIMDQTNFNSDKTKLKKWKREELYDV